MRFAVLIGTALVLGTGIEAAAADPPADQLNVVLILADDLGYGDLSSYGATDLKTPNIDGMVASGMRFDRFYANSPVCSPTRAALLSGRYPDLVGVPGVIRTHSDDNWGFLRPGRSCSPRYSSRPATRPSVSARGTSGSRPRTSPTRGFDRFHGFLGDMMDDYLTIAQIRESNLYWQYAVVLLLGREAERLVFGRADRRYLKKDAERIARLYRTFFASEMNGQSFLPTELAGVALERQFPHFLEDELANRHPHIEDDLPITKIENLQLDRQSGLTVVSGVETASSSG